MRTLFMGAVLIAAACAPTAPARECEFAADCAGAQCISGRCVAETDASMDMDAPTRDVGDDTVMPDSVALRDGDAAPVADSSPPDAPLDAFEDSGPRRDAVSTFDSTVMPTEGDADGDLITDADEARSIHFDADMDGTEDALDLDSDEDGIPDIDEAGDADRATLPYDTDRDRTPDFRDTDSDNDGLSDAHERTQGSSPTRVDSDDDGANDLVEYASGTDPTRATDNPRARGDFVFVVPFEQIPVPPRDTLQFETRLPAADVYFLMDNTSSMGPEIDALQAAIRDDLVPLLRVEIADVWFGVAGFEDYPIGGGPPPPRPPYGDSRRVGGIPMIDSLGNPHDSPFTQYQLVTNDLALVTAAIDRYDEYSGGDAAEAAVHALYALATGDSLAGHARYGTTNTPAPCPAGGAFTRRGAACFRAEVPSIVILLTNSQQHNSPTLDCSIGDCRTRDYDPAEIPGGGPTYAETITALAALDVRVVGVTPEGRTTATSFLERLVTDTTLARGATGTANDYVFFHTTGTPIAPRIVGAVRAAAEGVPIAVSARAVDVAEAGETVDAVAAFIDHLETRTEPAPGLVCTTDFTTTDRAGIDADSHPDTFERVTPSRPVCFDVIAKTNRDVLPLREPSLFRARIDVLGDGSVLLDEREIIFLVPPRVPNAGER